MSKYYLITIEVSGNTHTFFILAIDIFAQIQNEMTNIMMFPESSVNWFKSTQMSDIKTLYVG